MTHTLRGLYAITSQAICADPPRLQAAVSAALAGGTTLIQYRDKWSDAATRESNARALLKLCRAQGVPLIINDDLDLACATGADGVHLGASDAPLAAARRRLGREAIVGVTCGDSMERARKAAEGGASYIALGRFFASRTKPDAPGVSLEHLAEVRRALPQAPVCAIGGVTPDNGAQLVRAGAEMLAAVDAIFRADDIAAAAARFAPCFA